VAVNVTPWPVRDGFAEDVSCVAVPARFTECATTGEALPANPAAPAYSADIGLLPAGSDDTLMLAWPLTSAPVATGTSPLFNVTVPDGIPALLDTPTVKVTAWPNVDGLGVTAFTTPTVGLGTIVSVPDFKVIS
jgi:hypothetical protein